MPRLGERHSPVRDREERDVLVTENRRLSFFAARLWARKFRLDSEDARSECDVALIKAAELWRPDGGRTFAGYAVRAMFNQLFNFSMKERRRGTARSLYSSWEQQVDPRQDDPAEVANDRSELAAMREAIGRLDPRSQQVMLARASGELFESIARRMGVSRQRVQQIEQQARARLLELMGSN